MNNNYSELQLEANLLSVMMDHWIHEDELFWIQIRYLVTLQIAFFTAWYFLFANPLSVFIMIVSSIISILIYRLSKRIRKNRDVNVPVIKAIANKLIVNDTIEGLGKPFVIKKDMRWDIFEFATHSLSKNSDAGYIFQRNVFLSCIVINITVAFVSFVDFILDLGIIEYIH